MDRSNHLPPSTLRQLRTYQRTRRQRPASRTRHRQPPLRPRRTVVTRARPNSHSGPLTDLPRRRTPLLSARRLSPNEDIRSFPKEVVRLNFYNARASTTIFPSNASPERKDRQMMQEAAHLPLTQWENFYVIVGSSAGALTGLQFVVMTLIAESSISGGMSGVRAFGTPTIVHFCAVLLVSAIISAPWPSLAM